MNINTTKTFSWKKAVLVSLGVGLLVAGLSLFIQTNSLGTLQAFWSPQNEQPLPSLPSGTGSSFEQTSKPVRLRIPAIGVDAAVQSVGLSWRNDGTMAVPSNFTDVAWYNKGPNPGMPGSAVLAGHLDGKDVPQAVFFRLGDLKRDDLVEVTDEDGKKVQFRVIETKTYDYNAETSDIFANDGSKTRLNLITCGGNWDKTKKIYDKRVVVFTEKVSD